MTDVAEPDRRYIPDELKAHDIWAVWTPELGKTIMAPWETGHCYPASWGSGVEPRPETDFETAKMIADLPTKTVHESYPFPDEDDEIPDSLEPTIILPHDPPEPPLMFVDLDDVRDPESGDLCPQAASIVEVLDAYTEVSQSGTGLHLFVRAELPGNRGKFIEPLYHSEGLDTFTELRVRGDGDDIGVFPTAPEEWPALAELPAGHEFAGDIELYDHGRVVGATWEHVDGTPYNVPERQAEIDGLVDQYSDPDELPSHSTDPDERAGPESIEPEIDPDGSRSAYYDVGIRAIADTSQFARYRKETPGQDDWSGPHPVHGPQHSDPGDCTNFGVDPSDDTWYCFAHDSGGMPLHLAAIRSDETDLHCRDLPANAAKRGFLEDEPIEMLRTCLWLREQIESLEGEEPPYAALRGVAKVVNLDTEDGDILGKSTYKVALSIYSDLNPGDI